MSLLPAPCWRFCGRRFTAGELQGIRELIAQGRLHRVGLSRRVCEQLGWINAAGRLKEMSCRVALLRMERAGLIRLPPPQRRNGNGGLRPGGYSPEGHARVEPALATPAAPLTTPVAELPELRLEWVSARPQARLYRHLMAQYHYLGYRPMAGAQGRYLLRSGPQVLGALGLGAAAWSVAERDRFIGWSPQRREQNLHRIVNNSRFLILPWVKSPNLASWVLARLAQQLPRDWLARYGYPPVLLESFVEQDRFAGTCYKAANWQCLGGTKGRGKLEKNHGRVVPLKWILVYPLSPNFRAILNP